MAAQNPSKPGPYNRYFKVGGKHVLNPGPLKEAADAIGIPDDFWGLANSITLPAGQKPGSAWFILKRTDAEALDKNTAVDIVCTHEDSQGNATTTTFKTYYPVRMVLAGKDGDSKAPYLCEFQDKRCVLAQSASNKEYNVRIPVPKGSGVADRYFADTLDSSALYTWQTELDDLWDLLPSSIRGTAPTLAYTPTHSPADHSFLGTNAWYDAIGSIIDFTQSVLTLNPKDDAFDLVKLGEAQDGLSDAQEEALGRLLYDYKPRDDFNKGTLPEKIRICFEKRTKYSASSNLLLPPARSWSGTPVHTRDVSTSFTGAETGTILSVWSDMVAEYDLSGSVLNGTDLNTSGDSLAGEVKNRLDIAGARRKQVYAGCLTTMLTGSQVHEVRWRDYGDGQGMVTEIRAMPERFTLPGRIPVRRFPAPPQMLCRPNQDIAKAATDEVSVYAYPGGTETDSTEDPDAKALGAAVGNGMLCTLTLVDDLLVVAPWECDE